MKISYKKIISLILIFVFLLSQLNAKATYIYAAKSRSLKAQENLANNILPAFRYDRNNIELNERSAIDLILEKNSKIVKVEVVGAESAGLGIDSTTLLNNGLIILRPSRARSNNHDQFQEKERLSNKKNYKAVTFNLKKVENQNLIIEAIDFKIFKVLVRGLLPGSYTLKATIDGQESTITTVLTKADFRIDAISPQVVNIGVETELTIIGKGLNSLTSVSLGENIEVKEKTSLDDSTLKIKIFVDSDVSTGYRDITAFSPLLGRTVTLINGLLVNSPVLTPDIIGGTPQVEIPGPPGVIGKDGRDGKDGKSICENPNNTLMVLTNNLTPGSNATSFFDPVACNLIFGIPVGFNGINGGNGSDGKGLCNDMNATPSVVTNTLAAGSMATVSLDQAACTLTYGIPQGDTGTNGTNGTNGLSCWDLNGNGSCDTTTEDINLSGTCTVADCQGANDIPTVQEVVSGWNTYSNEQTFTTASSNTTRMVRIPRFIHDGVIYGGFWVDKYEASKANATATAEGTSTVPVGQRNVVPWTNISFTTAKSNASHADRQISSLGSCKLIGSKEWTALYILGRFSKENSLFGATATNGWNERGNTRDGNRDGRNSSSKTCSDDPNQSGTGDRCLTGTGYKSWGHILDGSATKNTDGTTFASSAIADDVNNVNSAFDGDKQVYDLVGNVEEWVDLTITNSSMSSGSDFVIDSGFQGAGRILPYTTDNDTVNFVDIAGVNDPQDKEFEGQGLPTTASGSITDSNGGKNGGKIRTDNTDAQYGVTRGGNYTSTSDATSPITVDFRNQTTATNDTRGFRIICDFASGQ